MLDTNICIYAANKRPEHVFRKIYQEQERGLCISSITLAELEYGAAKSMNPEKNKVSIMRLLFTLDVMEFGDRAATEYGQIRAYLEKQGTPIGALDMLIAAHAKSEGLILVTNNIREFQRVPDLTIENWVEV